MRIHRSVGRPVSVRRLSWRRVNGASGRGAGLPIRAISLTCLAAPRSARSTVGAVEHSSDVKPSSNVKPSTRAKPSSGVKPSNGVKSPADELVRRIGALRVRNGCLPLVPNDALRRAAAAYAVVVDGAGGVTHVDSVGGTAQDRARRQGYRGNVIELVAQGTLQPDDFMAALIQIVNKSDLLDCRFRAVGADVEHRHLVLVLGDRKSGK
jgi:uncharacterized protein YkwD